ncbi:hypothetical protein M3Y97_00098700 [Aphelenchoides bicaudatus]|nr:hypothetical protein M3Y97_00098700 [Aphelenchoides bicaudatus]
MALPPQAKAESAKSKRNKWHLVFAVLWILKSCILYVFCAEFFGLSLNKKYDCIGSQMDGWFDVRRYFMIAAVLLACGILFDFIMLVSSIFSPQVTVGFLCFSLFFHSVIILPQHVTGIGMAVKMKSPIPDEMCAVLYKANSEAVSGDLSISVPLDRPTSHIPLQKLVNGSFSQEIKFPELMLYRVLMVFSCIIVFIELAYFIVAVLFYMFLVWKPMPNFDDLANNPNAASPSNTFRIELQGKAQNNSVFTESKHKPKKAAVKAEK